MTERAAPARRARARRVLAVALAPALLTPLAACGGDRPVSPLPVRPASPTTAPASPVAPGPTTVPASPVVAPTVRPPAPAPRRPTRGTGTRAPTPSPSGLPDACLGPVRYDLVLAETEMALVRSFCFETGGVLRIVGIGPGEVTVDREDLVSRSYEAGVVDIRFVRVGTVVVTIPQGGTAHPVTVVVV